MLENNDPANTRTVILQQARQLFLSQGYHKTTMRTIAETAGISTGPLYFHFRNKAEVFFHICSEAFDYLIAEFRQAAQGEIHAALRLRNIYNAYKAFFYREPQLFEIMHLATNSMGGIDLPQSLAETLNAKFEELVRIMEGIIREGISRQELRAVDPCRLALYLYSVAEGVFLANRAGVLQRFRVSLDEMIETAIAVIGAGMIEGQSEYAPEREEDILPE